jgi:hypothetical protein
MAVSIREVVPAAGDDKPELVVGAHKDAVRPIGRDLQGGGGQPTAEQLAAGRARRAAQHQTISRNMAPPIDEEAEATAAEQAAAIDAANRGGDAPERADYDTIDLELPNGTVVTYGPVRGIGTALIVAQIVGTRAAAMLAPQTVEILLNIRAVDGVPIKIENWVQAQALLNKLENPGLEHIMVAHNRYWPPVRLDDLKVLQTRLR